MEDIKRIFAIILNILIPVMGTLLFLTLGIRLILFFFPFILAYIISLVANPMVIFLEKHIKLRRKHGSMVFVLIVLTLIGAIIYLIVSLSIYGIERLTELLPGMLESIRVEISSFNVAGGPGRFMPENTREWFAGIGEKLMLYFENIGERLATPGLKIAGNIVMKIPNALLYTVVIIVASYIFIVDRDKIRDFSLKYVPASLHTYISYAKRDLRKLVEGYFLSQFKIMLYMIVALTIGLLILGNKYAPVWALIIGVFDFLPVFGAGAILIPWSIMKIFTGSYLYGFGLILLYIITQVLKQVIQPKIVGDSVGLPGALTLVAVFIGFKLRGIGGMIIAIPMAMMIIKVYQYGIYDNLIKNVILLYKELNGFRKKYE